MRTRIRYKQVLLFLIAVALPSAVLILLTWRMIGQQEELSEKRQADDRRRLAREIGQKLLVRLEEIKVHEVSAVASGSESHNSIAYTSPEVVVRGLTNGEQLRLPWEEDQASDQLGGSLGDTGFFEKMHRAEEEEFARRQFDQANVLYLECIEEARQPSQQAYVRLSRARVLVSANRIDEGLAEYRKILDVGPAVADESGVPFWLYAAACLLERGDSYDRIARLLDAELGAPRWLSPAETYLIRDLVETLLRSGPALGTSRQAVEACQERILERVSRQEKALKAQREFPRLAALAQWNSQARVPAPVWAPLGEEPLLVGLAPALPGKQRLVIIVQGTSVLAAITPGTTPSERFPADVKLVTGLGFQGEPLGPSFPGLRVLFPADYRASGQGDRLLQPSFYLIALFAVLCVTFWGAYSLWRDVHREMRMAEVRSQFVASVSHELKTPLTAIQIYAESLRLGRPEDAQAKAEYLDTIVNESHRLTRLLNNVLDFSKIEKGKRAYHKELASLSEIVHAAVQATQYPLAQQDFHLSLQVEDGLPPVRVDRDAVELAIMNLLSNAIKYSGASREIDLRVRRRNDHVVIEVTDHGVGIPPSEQRRIFEKFYRVPSKENERIPGTGLGLALVAHIVEGHGGRVELQSVPGQGSTFSIHLPLEKKS